MPMNSPRTSPAPATQLNLHLEPHVTDGLSASERHAVTEVLAALLLEASGQAMEMPDEH